MFLIRQKSYIRFATVNSGGNKSHNVVTLADISDEQLVPSQAVFALPA